MAWRRGGAAVRPLPVSITLGLRLPQNNSFMNMFLSTWVLLVAGLLFALPMIHMRVQDHTDDEEL